MILDASVVFKWIRGEDEEDRDKAISLYKKHLAGRERITIISFTYLEIANILVTKTKVTVAELTLSLSTLLKMDLDIYEPGKLEIQESAILAKKYGTSVYDMLYAVIAKKHRTILLTADEKFVKATKFSFVKVLSEYNPEI